MTVSGPRETLPSGSAQCFTPDALDDVVAAVAGDAGREPSEEKLRAAGVDPDANRARKPDKKGKEPYPRGIEETSTGWLDDESQEDIVTRDDAHQDK